MGKRLLTVRRFVVLLMFALGIGLVIDWYITEDFSRQGITKWGEREYISFWVIDKKPDWKSAETFRRTAPNLSVSGGVPPPSSDDILSENRSIPHQATYLQNDSSSLAENISEWFHHQIDGQQLENSAREHGESKYTPESVMKDIDRAMLANVAKIQYGVISPETVDEPIKDQADAVAMRRARKHAINYLKRYINLLVRKNTVNHQARHAAPSDTPGKGGHVVTFTGDQQGADAASNILIVSTWRSGSTFLGELIASHPLVFYAFEPLKPFEEIMGAKTPHVTTNAASRRRYILRDILGCKFTSLTSAPGVAQYIDEFLVSHAPALAKVCSHHTRVCHDVRFLREACGVYPVRLAKTVRALVGDVEPMLSSINNLKVIFLARDPRGTWQSRLKTNWCAGRCNSTKHLCTDLSNNLALAEKLQERSPNRVKVVFYERLAQRPAFETKNIFEFLGLPVEWSTLAFLAQHTKQLDDLLEVFGDHAKVFLAGGVENYKTKEDKAATFRDSKKVFSRWRKTMLMSHVIDVQSHCKQVLKRLNYRFFHNENTLRNESIPLELAPSGT